MFDRIVDKKEFKKVVVKKIQQVGKMVGKKIVNVHATSIRYLIYNYVTSMDLFTTEVGFTSLPDFVNNMSVMRNFFNGWRQVVAIENPKKTKVVVRNWTRNHSGDKA